MDPAVLSPTHTTIADMVHTNDPPSIIDMEGTNASLSVITAESTNEPHLQFNPEAPTQVPAAPHLATDRDGEPPAADCSVCSAVSYETQFDSGCQVRSTYSNNTDNHDNHN
jgi:hypothetical protein